MDPINNIDRLVFVLRQRLQERTRLAAKPHAADGQGRSSNVASGGIGALAAVDGLDDRQLRRALIQNILSEHLGSEMLNDAKFQQVVDKVSDTISGDPESAALMAKTIGELRLSARA